MVNVAAKRRRDVRHGAEQQHAGADADQPPQHQPGVRRPRLARDLPDDLRADQQPDADHAADVAEQPGARVQRVAHVDRNQRPEAADREQAGGHRDHEEQDRRMVDDERTTRPSCRSRSRGCGCSTIRSAPAATPDARSSTEAISARRHQEAEHVDRVAHLRRELPTTIAPADRRADDAAAHERDLHQRVRGHQAGDRHVRADRHRLRRPEERRHAAERGQHDVDLPDRRRRNQQQREHGANQIARRSASA